MDRRFLVLAHRRARPMQADQATEPLGYDRWLERYRDELEGVDDSFDNGAGAFAAIVNVPDLAALDRLIAEYPWRAWIDVATRELPPVPADQRRRWRALADAQEEARRELRARGIDYDESVRRWRALLAEADAVDPYHPFAADLLAAIRHDCGDAGRYAEMETAARRLLALHERWVGPNDRALIIDWITLASACGMRDFGADAGPKVAEAEACYRRALELAERTLAPDDERVRDCVHQLGQHYKNRRRYARAEPLLRRLVALDEHLAARADQEARGGDERARHQAHIAALRLAADLAMLAELLLARHRRDEAEAVYRRIPGCRPDQAGQSRRGLGRVRAPRVRTRPKLVRLHGTQGHG